ncbi:MAG: hypothetical protein JRH19_16150 [Deltaproteobacteria bacterium]|nr:hypothetical protein [Deltaproteobacteria bacterium]
MTSGEAAHPGQQAPTTRLWQRLIVWGLTCRVTAALLLPVAYHNDIMIYCLQAARMTGLLEAGYFESFFPPGYPAFLALCRLVGGDHAFVVAVLIQQLLCVLSVSLIVHRLGLLERVGRRGQLFLFFVMADPVSLTAAQQLSPEILISTLVVGVWYLASRSPGARAPIRNGIGIGLMMGWGIAIKTVVFVFVPLVLLACFRPFGAGALRRGWREASAAALLIVAIPAGFVAMNARLMGQATLTDRTWQHVYNRVVAADQSFASEGAVSRQLLAYFDGDRSRVTTTHPTIVRTLKDAGLRFPEITALLEGAVIEALRERPMHFVVRSLYVPFLDWHRAPKLPSGGNASYPHYPDLFSPARPQDTAFLITSPGWNDFVKGAIRLLRGALKHLHLSALLSALALVAIPLSARRRDFDLFWLSAASFCLVALHSLGETFIGRYAALELMDARESWRLGLGGYATWRRCAMDTRASNAATPSNVPVGSGTRTR